MSTPDLHDFDFDLAERRAKALRRDEIARLIDGLFARLARALHRVAHRPASTPLAPASARC